MSDWPASSEPVIESGTFRNSPQDFQVTEHLSFEPSGDGEHCFLLVEKIDANTQWITKKLAQLFNVKSSDVGYAGLKDRHAVTRQWFSVHIPGVENPATIDAQEDFKVLQISRNNKKLKQGSVKLNTFQLVLKDIEGEQQSINTRLTSIRESGYPNYFGEQRFGHHAKNLQMASDILLGKKRVKRHQQSIYLSAIRSWFFNQFLAQRVEQSTWNIPQQGDRLMLSGSRSFFDYDANLHDELLDRLKTADIHIGGPLPGKDCLDWPAEQLGQLEPIWSLYYTLLNKLPGKTDWRPLRVIPQNLEWQWLSSNSLELSFGLPSGCYATGLLTELGHLIDTSRENLQKEYEKRHEHTIEQ